MLLTAVAAAIAAVALTSWMTRVADAESPWLASGLHPILAGLGGAGGALISGTWVEALTLGAAAVSFALLAVIDQATFRLPNALVGPTYPVLYLGLAAAAAIGGEWPRLGRALAGGAVLLVGYFILAFINPAGLGLGDVKLAGLLGGVLGWFGWPHLLAGTLAGFLVSGAVGVVILITGRGGLTSDFPFGPWMILGTAGGLMWGFLVTP